MNLGDLSCPHPECLNFAKSGDHIILYTRYGKKQSHLMLCKTCGRTFSELRGTIFWDSRLDFDAIENLYHALIFGVEGRLIGIRTVAKHRKVSKNTVKRYLRLAYSNPNYILDFLRKRNTITNDPSGTQLFYQMLERFPLGNRKKIAPTHQVTVAA